MSYFRESAMVPLRCGSAREPKRPLLEIFGGWFILRWAYSEEGEDSNGKKIETDYWICSADTATAKKHSLNVNKEAQAYLHIEDPIYGPAIVAPRSCF